MAALKAQYKRSHGLEASILDIAELEVPIRATFELEHLYCWFLILFKSKNVTKQELESILDRAASQLTGDKALQVPEDVFWFATQVRACNPVKLIAQFPVLTTWCKHPLCTLIMIGPNLVYGLEFYGAEACSTRQTQLHRHNRCIETLDSCVGPHSVAPKRKKITHYETCHWLKKRAETSDFNILNALILALSLAQAQDRFRWNLLRPLPLLQSLFRSKLWPEEINFKFTAIVYPAFVALLLFGPQDRAHNFGLNLFWCYWWPLIFIVYPFLGRIWCAGDAHLPFLGYHNANGHITLLHDT